MPKAHHLAVGAVYDRARSLKQNLLRIQAERGPTALQWIVLIALLLAGCANSEYRFERIDGKANVSIPMTFDSLYGARDGDSVTAEARFSDGANSAQLNLRLYLKPPAEFQSGTYRITMNGKTTEGIVGCQSLDYQGGQGSVPSMGGKFVLNPSYRVTFPSTPIKRR